jgi:hypothetical protein
VQGLHRARGVASSAVCLAAALMEVMALRAARPGGCCPTGTQIVSMQSNPLFTVGTVPLAMHAHPLICAGGCGSLALHRMCTTQISACMLCSHCPHLPLQVQQLTEQASFPAASIVTACKVPMRWLVSACKASWEGERRVRTGRGRPHASCARCTSLSMCVLGTYGSRRNCQPSHGASI